MSLFYQNNDEQLGDECVKYVKKNTAHFFLLRYKTVLT